MSDFYRNDPNQPYGDVSGQPADTGDASAWRQDGSFAPPSSNYQGQEDAFAAWRKPAQEDGTDASLLSGAPRYGAEMQQGGVPLYSQMQADAQPPMDFRAQGADAPTRIARAAIQGQMVNKYKT
ncbi:MAG: hypothetical protein EOM66_10220, partial [Clostridia bacterium]|nr:hypothetical protein [Clostridia bacterium]